MSFGGGSGGGGSISGADDVILDNPTDGQVLQYDGSAAKWQNSAVAASSYLTPAWAFDSPTSGDNGEAFLVPSASTITTGPYLTLDVAGSVDLIADVQYNSGSGWVSLYGTTKPKVTAGQTSAVGTTPTTQNIPSGALLRTVLTTSPTQPTRVTMQLTLKVSV